MDFGGELRRLLDVIKLLSKHGYSIHTTGPDASHKNGVVECPDQPMANVIRSMLTCAKLDNIFWPYSLHHTLFVHSLVGTKGYHVP